MSTQNNVLQAYQVERVLDQNHTADENGKIHEQLADHENQKATYEASHLTLAAGFATKETTHKQSFDTDTVKYTKMNETMVNFESNCKSQN